MPDHTETSATDDTTAHTGRRQAFELNYVQWKARRAAMSAEHRALAAARLDGAEAVSALFHIAKEFGTARISGFAISEDIERVRGGAYDPNGF